MRAGMPKGVDMTDGCPQCGEECIGPEHTCEPVSKMSQELCSGVLCGWQVEVADLKAKLKALRDKRDPIKYPYQLHISKATKTEYLKALGPQLPTEFTDQLKVKDKLLAAYEATRTPTVMQQLKAKDAAITQVLTSVELPPDIELLCEQAL